MPYRFRKKEKPLELAVRRIAGEQIEKAIIAIESSKDPALAAVRVGKHAAKVIDLLDLVTAYHQTAAAEADCFEEILQQVADASGLVAARRGFKTVRSYIESRVPGFRAARMDEALHGDNAQFETQNSLALTLLREAGERVGEWQVEPVKWHILADQACDSWDRARIEPSLDYPERPIEDLQALQRSTVRTWHQARLLRSVGSNAVGDIRVKFGQIQLAMSKLLQIRHLQSIILPIAHGEGESSPYEFMLVLLRREEILCCASVHRAMCHYGEQGRAHSVPGRRYPLAADGSEAQLLQM